MGILKIVYMRYISLTIIFVFFLTCSMQAQNDTTKYRRGSIYSVMIKHKNQPFADDLGKIFVEMPVPDKYNDHDLNVKIVSIEESKLKDQELITEFLQKNFIASRLVGKWFNRNAKTGVCDMELIKERGIYNASALERELAQKSIRGLALLEDAGEELLNSTFVLVNDISYAPVSLNPMLTPVLRGLSKVAAKQDSEEDKKITEGFFTQMGGGGYKVKVHTYLYRLNWDENISEKFYKECYTETADENKIINFNNIRGDFTLQYMGDQESSGSKRKFGLHENSAKMVRKACQRALDENVAKLQKNFEVFKVKAPLMNVSPLTSEIGLKEGMTEKSRYEVLEVVEDEKGHIDYKRVGIIKPMKDKIWDNRFMAEEEGAKNATLGFTTFEKVSGGDFYPGMLIREIK